LIADSENYLEQGRAEHPNGREPGRYFAIYRTLATRSLAAEHPLSRRRGHATRPGIGSTPALAGNTIVGRVFSSTCR
jgi:hypothetical protein